jgi:vitamin B12 transporter
MNTVREKKLCIVLMGVLLVNVNIGVASQKIIDSVQTISEVVVRSRQNREVIPSQKLDGKTLEALSSFSVADAIRYFSGVQVKDYGGIGGLKTVDIRSMGTNHMGVFYDGIQLGNAQNGQVDLGKFSLDNIDEISLYNGQKSEIFQSAKDFSNSGTIYLRSRKPQFKGNEKDHAKSVFRLGSFDLLNPSVLWEHKLSEKVSTSFSTEYIYSSGKYRFRYKRVMSDGTTAYDTSAIRKNGDIRALRAEAGIFGILDKGLWNSKVYLYDSERGIPGPIVNNVWKHAQRQWDRNFFTQASWQKSLTDKYDVLFNLKYANDYMRYLNPDTTLMYIDNCFRQQEIYASMANRYMILKNWDVDLSGDFQWNTLNSNMKNFVQPTRLTTLVALASAWNGEYLKIQGSLLATHIHDRVGVGTTTSENSASSAPDKKEFSPAVFLSYKPFSMQNINLRAFYKHIFRMPTFNDLYYTDIGNIALKPEYTKQYNLGGYFQKEFHGQWVSQVEIQCDAYYNEVTNKIVAIPKGNSQYRWMMMNLGYVEIRGIDVSNRIDWILPFQVKVNTKLNYTFQKAQDFTNPNDNDPVSGSYGGQIAYIPQHSGSAIFNVSKNKWTLNYSFIYVGERYHNSSNIQANYEPAWYTHDLTLGKTFKRKNMAYTVSAEINNILNQSYDVVLNYPMPGRNYKLIFKVEL